MTAFWIGAAALGALALAFLLVPLWRMRRREGRWSLITVGVSVLALPLAIAIYFAVSTYEQDALPEIPAEQAAMVAQLAERMAANPDDVEGWRLLGRSYMVLGQYAQGREAYLEAWNRTPIPDDELKLALGEALILTDRASIGAEAGQLIEEVLGSDPSNQKALWYGGLVALERGREDAACNRWGALLATQPPADVANVLQGQMLALGCVEATPAQAGAGAGPSLELDVTLGESLPFEALGADAALFVFARAPGGGPPVAVVRRAVSDVPGRFTLSDADSMLPGRSLGDFAELSLVARISRSGQPIEQSGDWFGQATYRQGDEGPVELVIDQVVP